MAVIYKVTRNKLAACVIGVDMIVERDAGPWTRVDRDWTLDNARNLKNRIGYAVNMIMNTENSQLLVLNKYKILFLVYYIE